MSNKVVKAGEYKIEFELQRKQVKNINLRVRPDLSVVVSAHPRVPYRFIEDFVRSKSHWIQENRERIKKLHQQDHNVSYSSGENLLFQGKKFRLKVREAKKEEPEAVQLYRDEIYIYVKDPGNFLGKEQLFHRWLRQQAEQVFHESLERVYPLVQQLGIQKPWIKIRKMKTRWGSCSRKRHTINLNTALVKAPPECIDYVMLHELVHFNYPYHDSSFYGLLTLLMPDWQDRKTLLHSQVRCRI